MVTVDDVRAVLARLPRSSGVLVCDRVKFRVGQIVYVAFSQDETEIGFAFPKEERESLIAAEPDATNPTAVLYLNRLSDLLFILSRVANDDGAADVKWQPGGSSR